MRFESVTAEAFGPLYGGTLELGPGMNVIFGSNESGKSSWHAALYAGLCGLRRSRGSLSRRDRRFAERHRPWDTDGWRVKAVLQLADGRRVELSHDLERRHCQVQDADSGRDYAAEIMHDGAPDGSRWLGLDRTSFSAVACVRQADIFAVIDDAGALQEHVQRAAASAGGNATAATALHRLQEFRRERVGSERVNATGPLRIAINWLEDARGALTRTESDHRDYLKLVAQVDGLTLRTQMARAAAALEAWRHRPSIPDLGGRTVDEIQSELDELSELAEGDTEVHPDVRAADEALRDAKQKLQLHLESQPPRPQEEPGRVGRWILPIAAVLFIGGVVAWLVLHPLFGVLLMFGALALLVRSQGEASARSLSYREWERWAQRRVHLEKEIAEAESSLPDALKSRQVAVEGEPEEALESYYAACSLRARRMELATELGARQALTQAIAKAAEGLRRAAAECAVECSSEDELAESLHEWLEARDPAQESAKSVEETERDLEEALESLNKARGRLGERASQLRSVPEAEEKLAAAEEELQRARDLERVLNLTEKFLQQAQERAHRTIAPILRNSIGGWLPTVTMNRYTDVRVDAETLDVQLCDQLGEWRKAVLLSHGTAEQVYLLLRVAMAEHLTRPGESCPLLLDDVTAQSDRMRTEAILRVLRDVSQKHQVILFTQEDGVLEWARSELRLEGRDQVVELAPG